MDSSDDFESESDDSEADEELVPTDNEAIWRQVRPPLLEFTAISMLLNKTALNGIQVKELGHIHLPVSLQDVTKLKGIADNGINGTKFTRAFDPSLTQAWEIDSSNLLSSLPENIDLPSLVTNHLHLPTDKAMIIQAKLTKLILYEEGGRYERSHNNSEKKFGTFGTAILQLPVEGGYKGGSLKVGSEEKSGLLFENHQNSDARFYLSAFYGSFEYFVMPITQGWQLTLVFDLVWTNTKIVKPYDTSVSLAALREIENATNQWITLNKDNSSMEISKQPSAKNEFEDASSPKPSKIISNESDDGRHNRNSLSSALKWKDLVRQQLSRDLHQIIEFWCTKPQRLWIGDPDFENERPTLRLLRLCITLRTRQGGLAILNAIGSYFDAPKSEDEVSLSTQLFEGIQNEQVAQAIAEFSLKIADFDECADLIQRMISPNRLARQFGPIIKLIKSFLDMDFIRGAIMIEDCVEASIVEVEKFTVPPLEQSAIKAYIESILSLETYSEDPNEERIASFITFFSKLQLSLQCYMVLHLESQDISRYLGIKSFQSTFEELCKALLDEFHVAPSVEDVIVNLMSLYVRLENSKWLRRLIHKICPYDSNGMFPNERSEDINTRQMLLKKLALSEEIWTLATSSQLGKLALTPFVRSYFKLLLGKLSVINKKEEQSPTSKMDPIDETLLRDLSSCLQLVIRMQSNPLISDSWWTDEILEQLVLLSADQLWYLLDDINKSKSKILNSDPCFDNITSCLCTSMLDRMKMSTKVMSRPETILNAVTYFIELCDESLVNSVLCSICAREVITPWDKYSKYELFNNLLNSSDVWSKLSESIICDILNSCADLVLKWISQIFRTLDSKNISHLNEFESNIYKCAKFFILIETKRYDCPYKQKASRMAPAFRLLSEKLSPSALLRMLDCVYNPAMEDKPLTNQPFERIPVCLNWCRDVCKLLFSVDVWFLSNLAKDAAKIVDWLFWLDDDRSWALFTEKICASCCFEKTGYFVRVFLLNVRIQEAIADNPLAFTAFIRIADDWSNTWKSLSDFTWKMPRAIVPDHPEVESFLRSSKKTLRYANFTDSYQMNILATDLEQNGTFMGFSVSVTPDEKVPCCEIVKTREYYTRVTRDFKRIKLESDELVKLRLKISQMRAKKLKAKRSNPIGVSSTFVPPAKRRTL